MIKLLMALTILVASVLSTISASTQMKPVDPIADPAYVVHPGLVKQLQAWGTSVGEKEHTIVEEKLRREYRIVQYQTMDQKSALLTLRRAVFLKNQDNPLYVLVAMFEGSPGRGGKMQFFQVWDYGLGVIRVPVSENWKPVL